MSFFIKAENYRKTIAVFDFDGTLIRGDSFSRFILFAAPRHRLFGSFVVFPALILFILGLLPRHRAKEIVFSHFFKNMKEPVFREKCREFSLKKIDKWKMPFAMKKVNWHRGRGDILVIATASVKNWVELWASQNGFVDIIATEIEIKNGRVTGKFTTPNCFGEEKKRRFIDHYPNRSSYFLHVYSDSKRDKPLLSLADKSYLNSF